jgi:biotin carboxyl carrier protein
MFTASVNSHSFEVTLEETGVCVDQIPLGWDLVKISQGTFHILLNQQGYRAEVVKMDFAAKSCTLKINNKMYEVRLKDKFDLLLEKMGLNNNVAGKVNAVKAPMPGLIIDLRVSAGDRVSPGDPLIILEAMKMENIIKSTGEGVVKSVLVAKGASVEKGQVLIEF